MADPAVLEQIACAVERIAYALERLADQRTAADPRMGQLLRAVFAAIGSEPFVASRIAELARSPARPALAHAVGAAGPKAIGRRLASHAGTVVDGLHLVRLGRGRPAVYRLSDIQRRESRIVNHWGT